MRFSARRLALAAAGAGVLGMLLLALAFDWNWLRPALERHLAGTSHRAVRIDDLQVSLDRRLDITVRLRGLRIENAPWADTRAPLIDAREASFTMSAKSVWQRRPVVAMLRLVDAQIDLERQADGLRNWRLTRPDDRGPARVLVLALDARRSTLRFAHRGLDLDFRAASTPLDAPLAAAKGGPPLTRRIVFDGRNQAAAFSGEVLASEVLSFQQTGRFFALRGHMVSGASRLEADGLAADVFKQARLDGHLQLQGPSLAALRGFLHAPLPHSPAYRIEAELKKDRSEYTFAALKARIGRSDLAGDLAYDLRQDRPRLEARLSGDGVRLEDLVSLIGSDAGSDARPAPAKGADRAADAALFSDRPLGLARLQRLDAKLDLRFGRVISPELASLGALRLVATLERGRLAVDDLALGLAGGQADGMLVLDASGAVPAWQARLRWRDVRLDALWPAQATKQRVGGALQGRLDLDGQGDSVAAMAASATGRASLHLVDGRLSRLLDAKLELSPMQMLRGWLGGERLQSLPCAGLAVDFHHGLGSLSRLHIETDDSAIGGGGSIDLRRQRLDLWLTPTPRREGRLTLHKSIRVQGPLAAPQASLADRRDTAASPGCIDARL